MHHRHSQRTVGDRYDAVQHRQPLPACNAMVGDASGVTVSPQLVGAHNAELFVEQSLPVLAVFHAPMVAPGIVRHARDFLGLWITCPHLCVGRYRGR